MVVPGQGDNVTDKTQDAKQGLSDKVIQQATGAVPEQMTAGADIGQHGFASNENVFQGTFTPSNSEIMARNASEELANNLKTAQEMIKTGSVHPTLAPDMEETVKNVEALLTKCGTVMGDEAAASTKQMA
jgi:hypothetical protein